MPESFYTPENNEGFFDEAASIAASQKLTEWMGVLLADHEDHVDTEKSGSRVLHLRSTDDTSKTMSARITAGSDKYFPELELTTAKDAHTDFVTKVVKRELTNRYYHIYTVTRDNRYGMNDVERVDVPHPITQVEVNNMLKFAQLRPEQKEANERRDVKVRTAGSFLARLLGRR